jgi:type IV secretory pathway protease TraF
MRIDRTRLPLQIAVMATISAAYVAMLLGSEVHTPLIIYNASGSAPLGFYYLEQRLPHRGETCCLQAATGDRTIDRRT